MATFFNFKQNYFFFSKNQMVGTSRRGACNGTRETACDLVPRKTLCATSLRVPRFCGLGSFASFFGIAAALTACQVGAVILDLHVV